MRLVGPAVVADTGQALAVLFEPAGQGAGEGGDPALDGPGPSDRFGRGGRTAGGEQASDDGGGGGKRAGHGQAPTGFYLPTPAPCRWIIRTAQTRPDRLVSACE